MLTREEADEIRKKYWVVMHGLFNTTASCEYLSKILDEFTEVEKKTPKRRIHVGDIYRDADGVLRELSKVEGSLEGAYDPIYTSTCGYDYDMTGKYIGECDKAYLDTSICYQLVEVEDE
jgi:hypothetical protein